MAEIRIKKIVFPFDNLKDLEDIPEAIKKDIEFVPVKTMDEVLEHALIHKPQRGSQNEN